MHRSDCFILWHRSCKILKSMICCESEAKKIDSKRHGTYIVAKYMRYSTRPTWIISYASLYFEFETLYSTDVSLMYIRANASVSGACMYIRRSTNINAQIRNTSTLSSSTKCRNRSSIEHVQCTRRTVSRDEKKNTRHIFGGQNKWKNVHTRVIQRSRKLVLRSLIITVVLRIQALPLSIELFHPHV